MNIFLIVMAVVLFVAFVANLIRTVDPDRVAMAPFGRDRESLRHPDRDHDRVAGELSAIRAHSVTP